MKFNPNYLGVRSIGATVSGLVALGTLAIGSANAQISLYVLQMGDGSSVSAAYAPFTILNFSATPGAASLANSYAAPSVNAEDRITMGSSFTTYGFLTQSVQGNHLVFTGRDVAVGGATGSAQNVVVGTFALNSNTFDTSTRLPLVAGNGYRGAASVDGNQFWIAGQAGGIHYATLGQTTATTSILTTGAGNPSNIETAGVQIVDNTIMFSRRAGTDRGIQFMPEGLHTTHGNDRFLIEGSGWLRTGTVTPSSYHDFKFFGNDTLFVSNANNIQVYHRSNAETDFFDLLTGVGQGLTDLTGETHLSVMEHDGQVYLFYTTGTGTASSGLYSVLWNPELQVFSDNTLLASAAAGYTFAGLVAIPEPSTYALLFGAGVLIAACLRRRRPAAA